MLMQKELHAVSKEDRKAPKDSHRGHREAHDRHVSSKQIPNSMSSISLMHG